MPSLLDLVIAVAMARWTMILGGVLAGFLWFLLGPILVGQLLPRRFAERLSGIYFDFVMGLLGRALLVKRTHGGFALLASEWDPDFEAEKATLGGKTGHWKDPKGYMSRWRNRPFGIVHEQFNVIVAPHVAEWGRIYREHKEDGTWEVKDHKRAFFEIDPESDALVDIDDVLPIIQGSASPYLGGRAKEYIVKSQSLFDKHPKLQYMFWVTMVGVGFGMMWLGAELGGTVSGADAPTVPLPTGMLGVLVVML